jgi:ATP:corrinoid adenosyltransferase
MASLIDSLINDMDKENSLYNELYELAKVKTTAIVNSDVEKLQAILVDEQALISKISAVESDRIKVVDEICNILHLSSKDVKVEDVVQMLRKRPLEHNRLQESYLALKRTVKALTK